MALRVSWRRWRAWFGFEQTERTAARCPPRGAVATAWLCIALLANMREPALAQAGPPADVDCGALTELHGYLSRAQLQCGGLQSNVLVARAAEACASRLGKAKADERLAAGRSNFDRRAQEGGRDQACKEAIEHHGGSPKR
jgi:hypothetical protein